MKCCAVLCAIVYSVILSPTISLCLCLRPFLPPFNSSHAVLSVRWSQIKASVVFDLRNYRFKISPIAIVMRV